MTIISWKTNSIDLNKPAKVISGTADSFVALSIWGSPNSDDDPYWSGGTNPKYYRWEVTFTVPDKTHGSNLTRVPFTFNAQDIEVGDWVAGASVGDGKCCQITSIKAKTNNSLTAIVEDRFRYNTFKSSGGDGLFGSPGPVIFFQINELGLPMLDPLPGEAGADFFTNVMSRFQYMNPLTNYLLEKPNHGFEQGEAICIENGQFVLSNSTNVVKFIGTILHSGPGPDQFILRPSNGIIDFVPGLPGTVGDFIYPTVDSTGNLTTNAESDLPIFLKIADSMPSTTIGIAPNITGNDGDVIEINKIKIVLNGDGSTGKYDLNQAIEIINNRTVDHNVIADKVGSATTVESDSTTNTSAYGVVGGYTPFSASINGITVTFTTTRSGGISFGDPAVADSNDLAADINSANIPNIIASVGSTGNLILKNIIGGTIDIINITGDSNGKDFAGTDSISSLSLSTAANTSDYSLRLSRPDGGPLTLFDNQGSFFTDAGVMSGQNGRYALGLMIERGLATKGKGGGGNVTVTSNIDTIVPGSTISIGVDYNNKDYPGGLFTVFQQQPIQINVTSIWATLDSNVKNAYLDFTSNTINSKDVVFSINVANAVFGIKSTDDITIGNSIVSGVDLTGLNINGNGAYTISSSLISVVDETASNVAITANLTTDRGIVHVSNVYLNNIQPTPFSVTSISASWTASTVPFWIPNQTFSWSTQLVGTATAGNIRYTGATSGTLSSTGAISGTSPSLDSTQSYSVQSSDYRGNGLNGAGNRLFSTTISKAITPATRYYPLFYKTTFDGNNPNITTSDSYLRSQYALGQGADTTTDPAKYLWLATPGSASHTFAYTIFQTAAVVAPDRTYLNQTIGGQTYNVYGFTNASLVTKIYTTS